MPANTRRSKRRGKLAKSKHRAGSSPDCNGLLEAISSGEEEEDGDVDLLSGGEIVGLNGDQSRPSRASELLLCGDEPSCSKSAVDLDEIQTISPVSESNSWMNDLTTVSSDEEEVDAGKKTEQQHPTDTNGVPDVAARKREKAMAAIAKARSIAAKLTAAAKGNIRITSSTNNVITNINNVGINSNNVITSNNSVIANSTCGGINSNNVSVSGNNVNVSVTSSQNSNSVNNNNVSTSNCQTSNNVGMVRSSGTLVNGPQTSTAPPQTHPTALNGVMSQLPPPSFFAHMMMRGPPPQLNRPPPPLHLNQQQQQHHQQQQHQQQQHQQQHHQQQHHQQQQQPFHHQLMPLLPPLPMPAHLPFHLPPFPQMFDRPHRPQPPVIPLLPPLPAIEKTITDAINNIEKTITNGINNNSSNNSNNNGNSNASVAVSVPVSTPVSLSQQAPLTVQIGPVTPDGGGAVSVPSTSTSLITTPNTGDGAEYVPPMPAAVPPQRSYPSYKPTSNHVYIGFGKGSDSAEEARAKIRSSYKWRIFFDRDPRLVGRMSREERLVFDRVVKEKEEREILKEDERRPKLGGLGAILRNLRDNRGGPPAKRRLIVSDKGVPITDELSVDVTLPSTPHNTPFQSSAETSGVWSSLSSAGSSANANEAASSADGQQNGPCDSAGHSAQSSRKPSPLQQQQQQQQGQQQQHQQQQQQHQQQQQQHHQQTQRHSSATDDASFVGPNDVPAPPPHPTDPAEIRKMMRMKMTRCKRCKNRFLERPLYERHLKEKHPEDFLEFIHQQKEEARAVRMEEKEAKRIEELTTGGYVPPADDVLAEKFEIGDLSKIPLPGELSGGIPATFDRNGLIRQPRRRFRKKVSPQCPFCDKRFTNDQALKKHFVKRHPKAVNFTQCNRCLKALKSEHELRTHACELVHVCFECIPLRNMCTVERLIKHRAKFHRGPNSGFRCKLCSQNFLTFRRLRKHRRIAHPYEKLYACHFCEDIFVSETEVTVHERVHTGMIKFVCRFCDHTTVRFGRMEAHEKGEHGYICSICKEKFREWAEIKNHTLSAHGGYLTSEGNATHIECSRVWIMYKGE